MTNNCEVRIRPKEDIYISVLFAPTRLSCMLAKLEIKQCGPGCGRKQTLENLEDIYAGSEEKGSLEARGKARMPLGSSMQVGIIGETEAGQTQDRGLGPGS